MNINFIRKHFEKRLKVNYNPNIFGNITSIFNINDWVQLLKTSFQNPCIYRSLKSDFIYKIASVNVNVIPLN